MNKRLKNASIMAVIAFLVCLGIYIFIPEESSLFYPITDSLFIILAAIAGMIAIYTFKTAGWRSKEGKVWLFLGLGYLGWAVGELLWTYNEIILEIEPFPSTADIFYIAAYIPMLIGLWIEYKIIKEAVQKKEIIKASVLTFIAVVISAYLVLVPIITTIDYDLLSKIISLSYPIGDLLILFPALLFIFVFKGAKMSKSWLLIAIAITLTAIADTAFAYLDWNELYTGVPFTLTDLTWLADYILFAFGAYYHKLILKGEI